MWALDWLALILKTMYLREDSSCKGGCVGGRGGLREVGGRVGCLRHVSGCLQQGVSSVLMKGRYQSTVLTEVRSMVNELDESSWLF